MLLNYLFQHTFIQILTSVSNFQITGGEVAFIN